ncbi:MAG: fibronectin type III domain-containing protein [Syntrophomonadaceae bacterium]|nr:fibronectin type III domain-containing protein [Syntrophomonadaceae bacterium]
MYNRDNIRRCKRPALLIAFVLLLSLFLALPAAAANTFLTSPAGGESWTVGSSQNITWNPIPEIFTEITVNLDFSTDSGATWISIANGLEMKEGQYTWDVPNTPTTKAKVRLSVLAEDTIHNTVSKTEELSGDFTIKSGSILPPQLPYDPSLPLLLPPAAPVNLSASASSSSNIVLNWEDKSGSESGFKIERKNSGNFEQIATVAADIKTFQDLNLDPATTYTYRVKAYNGFGDSSYTDEAAAQTDSVDDPQIPPVLPPRVR